MTLQEAIKSIIKNWENLHDKQADTQRKDYSSLPKSIAVWCAKSDTAGSYEVDEEWIGITPQGRIAWAYASGCSCWDGDFEEKRYESMKEVVLNHNQILPKEWEKAIINFAKTGERKDLK